MEEFASAIKTLPESNTPAVSNDTTTTHHIDPSATEPSTSSPTSKLVEFSATEPESTEPRTPANKEVGTVGAFLSHEKAFPSSPAKKHQLVDGDIDSEVLVLDEKSDWTEVEN